jgi:hypothetical protein
MSKALKLQWMRDWLVAQRKAHGYSNAAKLLEALETEGIHIAYSDYASYESPTPTSKRIEAKPALVEAIAAFYRVDVPTGPAPAAPESDIERLIASNIGLTHSISLLVNALLPAGQSREERSAALVAQIAALSEELAALQQGGADEHPSHPGSQRRAQG